MENDIDFAYNTSNSTLPEIKKAEMNRIPSTNGTGPPNPNEVGPNSAPNVVELLDTFVGGLPSDFTFTVPQHTLSKIAPQLALATADNFNVNMPEIGSMSPIQVKDTLSNMIEQYYGQSADQRKQTMNIPITAATNNKYNIRVSVQGGTGTPHSGTPTSITSCRVHLTPV